MQNFVKKYEGHFMLVLLLSNIAIQHFEVDSAVASLIATCVKHFISMLREDLYFNNLIFTAISQLNFCLL
uniref:Uncharacterized protein n=1 Tax=Rhizophora mucronata TaxID=61149 RepID=A0A2P2P6N5_RHIMU